jgi:hypothetical protein
MQRAALVAAVCAQARARFWDLLADFCGWATPPKPWVAAVREQDRPGPFFRAVNKTLLLERASAGEGGARGAAGIFGVSPELPAAPFRSPPPVAVPTAVYVDPCEIPLGDLDDYSPRGSPA